MRNLAGKICIVAGGATGIGRTTAIRLAEEGANVVVGDINLSSAEETAARAKAKAASGATALAVRFDMTDEASIAAMVKTAVDTFGGLDAIHVNANDMSIVGQDSNALEVPLAIFDRTITVGLRGHLLCTRAALPELLKRGGGAIVYTTSVLAYTGEPTCVSYGVAKAGLTALTRHVAKRWGKEGIRANAVAPGLVLTEHLREQANEEFKSTVLALTASTRLGEPEDIAAMVALLFSGDGAWINGQVIAVDGGSVMR